MRASERWYTLDAIKAVGIIAIIIEHLVVWWFVDETNYTISPYYNQYFFSIFLNSLIFLTVVPISAGAAFRFYLKPVFNKKIKKNKKAGIFVKNTVKKAVLLILIGYLLNFIVFGKDDFLDWDVLQFLGVSFIVSVVILKLSSLFLFSVFGASTLLLSPFLVSILDNYKNNYFVAVLIGNDSGYFFWPFFPHFTAFAFGFLVAHYYLDFKSKSKINEFYTYSSAIGFVFIFLAILKNKVFFEVTPVNFWGPNIFQPPVFTAIGLIGINLLFIIILDIILKKKKPKDFGVVHVFSSAILWIFIFHLIVGYHAVMLLKNSQYYGAYILILLIFIILILSYALGAFKVWLRKKGHRAMFI